MHEKQQEADGVWLDRLDEIADGVDESLPGDDELLQLARHVHLALAPFRELDTPARAHGQRLRRQLRSRLVPQRSWQRWIFRPLMVAAALLLFILLGPGFIFESNLAGQNNHNNGEVPGWHMSDLPSTQSYQVLSLTRMPHRLVLLVPTNLVPNAYVLAMHISAYGANASVQSYLIYEQNALIYEAPSPPLSASAYSNSAYQTVYAGSVPIFVTHTPDGNNRLEWYQSGLLCDFISEQPVAQLLPMVHKLQPVTY